MSHTDPVQRRNQSLERRKRATDRSAQASFPSQTQNDDEQTPYIFNFTKGLKHSHQGLLETPAHYEQFIRGVKTADPAEFAKVKLHNVGSAREYESPTGGHCYVLEGPDAMALTMPPAPEAGSAELAAELGEVYQMALHRDFPVAAFMASEHVDALKASGQLSTAEIQELDAKHAKVEEDAARLSKFQWFKGADDDGQEDAIKDRRRFDTPQRVHNIYRGVARGDSRGPFVSQFLLMGTHGDPADGSIRYGNQRVDQHVRIASPVDYMTDWESWLKVQNAFDARGALQAGADTEFVKDDQGNILTRPISRLRDLATYVHDDQLYQAYLNATLILLGLKGDPKYPDIQFDRDIPYHGDTRNPAGDFGKNREPFAVFGGPHLLTMVTEVASRALRAVRNQKFIVHRRLRPEALAALMHTAYSGYDPASKGEFDDTNPVEKDARDLIASKIATYAFPTTNPSEPHFDDLLTEVRRHNEALNKTPTVSNPQNSWLLPMAFPEGSPMHPAYGAGHATVAGACVSMLKAFFSMNRDSRDMLLVQKNGLAYVPSTGEDPKHPATKLIGIPMPDGLTLEGELNKLAWNIANARNIAGVHYFTDYIESLILGENITIGILREQMTCYDERENVAMTLPLFIPRTLPPIFGVDPDKVFSKVKFNPDGQLTDS